MLTHDFNGIWCNCLFIGRNYIRRTSSFSNIHLRPKQYQFYRQFYLPNIYWVYITLPLFPLLFLLSPLLEASFFLLSTQLATLLSLPCSWLKPSNCILARECMWKCCIPSGIVHRIFFRVPSSAERDSTVWRILSHNM